MEAPVGADIDLEMKHFSFFFKIFSNERKFYDIIHFFNDENVILT